MTDLRNNGIHAPVREATPGYSDNQNTSPRAGVEAGAPENRLDISLVIPVYNEVANLELLYDRLHSVLEQLHKPYEIIWIDDGSTDGSFEVLARLHRQDPHNQVIRFRRNFGQTAAFSAGFDLARGDIVVTLDADLQNDPADIPMLLAKMDEGFDIVSGWRKDRKDPFFSRVLPSRVANHIIARLTGVQLQDFGCSLKAYRSEIVKNLRLYGELHRFIPALASWQGVRMIEIPVNHSPRQAGRSKYGLWRTVTVFLDLITVKFLLDFATRPIQIFGLIGMLCFSGGTLLAGYLTMARLFYGQELSNRPLLLLAILLIVLGVQLVTMGLLGELVVRTFHESRDKPIYVVRQMMTTPTRPEAEIRPTLHPASEPLIQSGGVDATVAF